MSTFTKLAIAFGVAAGIFGLAAFFGWSPFVTTVIQQNFGSSAGVNFNSAKVALVTVAPSTSAASSTSILNTDASGRWIEGAYAGCTGTGSESVAQLALGYSAATTSVANLGAQGNTNTAARLTIATSSAFSNISSTTPNFDMKAYWPSSTYLTFTFTATTSAACVIGVSYIPS